MATTDTIYGRLPVFGQNLALSLVGLRYRHERLGGDFGMHVASYREREHWDESRMDNYVQTRLRSILLAAFDHTSYYREAWDEAGITRTDLVQMTPSDLQRLPTTPKENIRSDPRALLSTEARRRRGLRSHHTSGSTGTPTTIFLTADITRQTMAAREARSFGWAGATIRSPRATIGARLVVPRPDSPPPYYRYNLVERQVYLSGFHLSPQNLSSYLEGLNRHRPMVLTGLSHSYYLLSRLMLEAGIRLEYRPSVAILGSEKAWPHMRVVIERALGVKTFEEYGSVENCVLATECEQGRLHMNPDFGVLEILDDSNNPSPPGEPGRLVCTGLLNDVQPLVRYEIGDLGSWAHSFCPCGRYWPVIEGIVGRQNDAIQTSDGRSIIGGDEIFGVTENVIEGQIVQENLGSFTIKVVAAPNFSADEASRLVEALRKRVGDVEAHVELVSALERTNAGKFKPVVNKVLQGLPEAPDIDSARCRSAAITDVTKSKAN